MHDLMSHCELCGEETAWDVDQSNDERQVADWDLKILCFCEDSVVYHPWYYHRRIECHPEIRIFLLELQSFFWGWVAGVKAKELIEDGKTGVNDADVEEWIKLVREKWQSRYNSEYEVRSWRVHETVYPENVHFLPRKQPLECCNDLGHIFNRDLWSDYDLVHLNKMTKDVIKVLERNSQKFIGLPNGAYFSLF